MGLSYNCLSNHAIIIGIMQTLKLRHHACPTFSEVIDTSSFLCYDHKTTQIWYTVSVSIPLHSFAQL